MSSTNNNSSNHFKKGSTTQSAVLPRRPLCMLQSAQSDGAQRGGTIPVPRPSPLPHTAYATHSSCARTPTDRGHTAASCLYPLGSNSKMGGKYQEPAVQANNFLYCPRRVFLGYTWQPCWGHGPEPVAQPA